MSKSVERGAKGLAVAAAILLGVAGTAWAQAVLGLEETKQCLVEERTLQQQRAGLEERKPSLAREEAEIERLRQRVEEAQSRVFLGAGPDPAARTEYETLRDLQYREYDLHSSRMRDYNADVTVYNEQLAAFNSRCGRGRYSDYNLRLARQQLGWE